MVLESIIELFKVNLRGIIREVLVLVCEYLVELSLVFWFGIVFYYKLIVDWGVFVILLNWYGELYFVYDFWLVI